MSNLADTTKSIRPGEELNVESLEAYLLRHLPGSRGPLVNYDDLYDVLASDRLRGAMLETFSIEPPPSDWPLLKLPNVTLSVMRLSGMLKTGSVKSVR